MVSVEENRQMLGQGMKDDNTLGGKVNLLQVVNALTLHHDKEIKLLDEKLKLEFTRGKITAELASMEEAAKTLQEQEKRLSTRSLGFLDILGGVAILVFLYSILRLFVLSLVVLK